jgi:hypothetical protein
MALLKRLASDNESLVGDIVEEFSSGRSRFWLWRQLLAAAVRSSSERRNTRPLGLDDGWISADSVVTGAARVRTVNLTGNPAPAVEVGGLGLVALGVLVAATRPEAWGLVAAGPVGGVLIGGVMVIRRHIRASSASTRNRIFFSGS